MVRTLVFLTLTLFMAMISSCSSPKKEMKHSIQTVGVAGPRVIIYQTKKDYSKFVPINLSADKKSIVSYPDIKDVFFKEELAYPTPLHKGFLLDNRGIDRHVAFLKLTYSEYSKLQKTPNVTELMNMILDTDPITEMYSCGLRSSYQNITDELNAKIDKGDFGSFVKLME